jgi:hypothetical protein
LRETKKDWMSRWENVQELLTFAREVEGHLEEQANQESSLHEAIVDDNVQHEMFDYWTDGQHELEVDETESFGVVVSNDGRDTSQPSDADG